MTDISVSRSSSQVENLSWLLDRGGFEFESATFNAATFTQATHYPNGFLPAGTVVAKITATGIYGLYDAAATDGRQSAPVFLGASIKLPADTTKNFGGPICFSAVVREAKLPFPAQITAAVRTALAGWVRFV